MWRIEKIRQKEETTYLSELERKRFNVVVESSTVKDAAQKMGLAPGTLYNWFDGLRRRLVRERGHVNAILGQTRRSELLRKELSLRKPLQKLEEVLTIEEADLDEEN
jgi:hypothetical protein